MQRPQGSTASPLPCPLPTPWSFPGDRLPPCSSHTCPPLSLQCLSSGLPDELIQKGKDIKGTSEIVQNGKHFKLTITTGSKVVQNEFTLGEECEMETLTGEKVKVGGAPSPTSGHPLLPELSLELSLRASSLKAPTSQSPWGWIPYL